jgi:hypothetical protein
VRQKDRKRERQNERKMRDIDINKKNERQKRFAEVFSTEG